MHNIFFTNTLSGKKEELKPIQAGIIKIYSCGSTVYDYAHIGNFRSFVFSDLLTRTLKYAGYAVTKVQNITDVGHLTADDMADASGEDKISKKAKLEKKDPFEIARFFENAFIEDEKKLRIEAPTYRPRATEYIAEQIALAQKLIANGFAYERNGSVYFEVNKFPSYGKLSKNKIEDLQAGARVEINDEKKSPIDFALWKKATPEHLMQWDSPWGRGFPGWHIECSAMSQKLLGEQFDIHTGGEDNIFPHHECEIAQNECSNGGKKSVNYWLHAKHLMINGEKMSKSKGNFFTIRDLMEKGWKGEEIRYALLTAHYRTTLNFSEDLLQQARSSIARIREGVRIFEEIAGKKSPDETADDFRTQFQKALFDDLNTADSLSSVFECINLGFKLREEKKLDAPAAASFVSFLKNDFDTIFNVIQEDKKELGEKEKAEIEILIEARNKARLEKNWVESDRIRNELSARNIELFDQAGKTTWKIK